MNHKERFKALFDGQSVDRIPIYFFGTWYETKMRWKKEGLVSADENLMDYGPQIPGMDPDWEQGLWDCHGLAENRPIGDIEVEVIEEADDYIIKRTSVGNVEKESKLGSSISHALEYGLKPTHESWQNYKKFLDPNDKRRRPVGWEKKAEELNAEDRVLAFMGGSLYGWLRNWMGIEAISMLMYDDLELFEEMVSYLTDYQIKIFSPVFDKVKFDFVYFFEDCCGVNGPLFSPKIYNTVLDKYYKKLISFYKEKNVNFTLIDCDGKIDKFIPLWLESGFDIIFPIEVGTWKASPGDLRDKFGRNLKMLGGIDKHVIALGESAIREHLIRLKPEVLMGGFLPIPDHRIPPECSLQQFLIYIKVFNEVFNEK